MSFEFFDPLENFFEFFKFYKGALCKMAYFEVFLKCFELFLHFWYRNDGEMMAEKMLIEFLIFENFEKLKKLNFFQFLGIILGVVQGHNSSKGARMACEL